MSHLGDYFKELRGSITIKITKHSIPGNDLIYSGEKKMSLRDLEDPTGISTPHLCQLESGKRRPNIATLIKLADFYQIDIQKFIDKIRLDIIKETI